jgi:hypothetical protein
MIVILRNNQQIDQQNGYLAMHMSDDIYILLINDLIIRKSSSSLFLKLHNL